MRVVSSFLLLCAALMPQSAHAAQGFDKGDTTFMVLSTVLVLLMILPGLALFYGGLVRAKNMLSILTQVLTISCLVMLLWVTLGYSLVFTGGPFGAFIGGVDKAFLRGVTVNSAAATFSNGVAIPEMLYMAFQMTFAAITPALIIGALAERVRFSALMLFTVLWMFVVYVPVAHMVWYWQGPDVLAQAAQAVLNAADDAARALATEKLEALQRDAGLLFQWGALDFAGGTVVHINAGMSALVGAAMIGKRIGYGRDLLAPHSLTMTFIGIALLWVGWFGFNAGSNLEANGTAVLAMVNTLLAPAAAGLSWMLAEWTLKGRPSMLGLASGVVAGLVAITPASGFSGPMGAIVLGLIAGPLCYYACAGLKHALGYDDSLDVFGIHGIGGIIGALATGVLVNPDLGGTGIADYIAKPGELVVAAYEWLPAMLAQAKAVGFTLVYSGVASAILFKFVDLVIGLRVAQEQERQGLDIIEHGERAYSS